MDDFGGKAAFRPVTRGQVCSKTPISEAVGDSHAFLRCLQAAHARLLSISSRVADFFVLIRVFRKGRESILHFANTNYIQLRTVRRERKKLILRDQWTIEMTETACWTMNEPFKPFQIVPLSDSPIQVLYSFSVRVTVSLTVRRRGQSTMEGHDQEEQLQSLNLYFPSFNLFALTTCCVIFRCTEIHGRAGSARTRI